jgi:hypothetical protein
MFWLAIAFIGFLGFTISNLTLTGAIVLFIGLLLNLAPVLANWSVPVSELALQSVGVVDAAGEAVIDSPRESTSTAGTLSFLGDVIPVPVVNKVISIGDLIALVAVADIIVNLMLRERRRELDDAGVTFVETPDDTIIDLRDDHSGPAHAAPGGLKLTPPLPRVRRPAHAAAEPEPERDIPPPSPTARPLFANDVVGDDDPVIDLTDHRPIIDLTLSPTDDQLAEFLRRRAEADRRIASTTATPPPPAPRRARPRRRLRDRSGSKSRV